MVLEIKNHNKIEAEILVTSLPARAIISARTIKLVKLFLCFVRRFNLLEESYQVFQTCLPTRVNCLCETVYM